MIGNHIIGFFILAMLFANTSAADKTTLDSFDSNPSSRWAFISDQVMGGISTGRVTFTSHEGENYAQLEGTVSTANNGGFIQFRSAPGEAITRNATGVFLRAKGNNQRYFIHLRTKWTKLPWQYYQSAFDVTDVWQEYRLPLNTFEPSGGFMPKSPSAKSLTSIGVVAFGRDHVVNIQVEEIGFY